MKKKAILAVSFGTSYTETRELTIGAIEKAIGEAFPEYEVFRAFTSQMIIDKLRSRDGLVIDMNAQRLLFRLELRHLSIWRTSMQIRRR